MTIPLYDDFGHHATQWVTPAQMLEHCTYLKDRGFTGIQLSFANPFNPNTALRQSGVNGVKPVQQSSGTSFVITPAYGNYVRSLVDAAGAAGLTVMLQTYGAAGNWIGESSDNSVLRVQNAYAAGQELARYFKSSSDVTHLIHGWDTDVERTWEDSIWENVRAGWEDGVNPAVEREVSVWMGGSDLEEFVASTDSDDFNTWCCTSVTVENMIPIFEQAQAAGKKVWLRPFLAAEVKTSGSFDEAKYQNKVDAYAAAFVADQVANGAGAPLRDFEYWIDQGVFTRLMLVDEPQAWSPAIPYATVDNMAAYWKVKWPNTIINIRTQPTKMNSGYGSWTHVDGGWCQWVWSRGFDTGPKVWGGMQDFIDEEKAATTAAGMSLDNMVWGMAAQHGGQPLAGWARPKDGAVLVPSEGMWGIPIYSETPYGGEDYTSSQGWNFWYMRIQEIEEWQAAVGDEPGVFNVFRFQPGPTNSNPGDDWADVLPSPHVDNWNAALTAWVTAMRYPGGN